jgi:SAM-dependent methyltransferase
VALDLAELTGDETILDVGCGNGTYLSALRRRGHRGPVLGLDYSPGMARHARAFAATTVADAQALPIAGGAVDLALCMHMLYHVADPARAIAQLGRVVRPDGTALVALNAPGHIRQLRAVLVAAAQTLGVTTTTGHDGTGGFSPAAARALLAGVFAEVNAHDVGTTFQVPDPDVVRGFLASWPPETVGLTAGPVWDAVLAAAGELVTQHFAEHGGFAVSSGATVLVCRSSSDGRPVRE